MPPVTASWDDTDENQKSFDRVKAAIAHHEKTITLSVGQLTTGVTIPEWSAVLMISNLKSPALYMQAAFRAQNPCLFHENGIFCRKENAYVFDFDPARTLLIYERFANDFSQDTALQDLTDAPAPVKEEHLEPLKKSITKEIIAPMVEQAKQEYGRDLKLSDQKRFESTAKAKMDVAVNKVVDNYRIDQSQLETQRTQQRQQVNREFDAKQQQSTAALMETLQSTIQQTAQEMQQTIVRTVETNQKEQEKKGCKDTVRDHLRGFSRTIPSFLMAYGDETVTLANFDRIIPDKVFQEVTSITLEQFRFLRYGGPYINQATGQEEHFAGHLFDPVVFDDSVKEFLNLKIKLADYFDESRTEDIFDYIPPQKTNQIFTPKWVVKKMVDLLEQENPGCFDDPGKTFLDPYMKSGLYITEIVKRLYRSEKMRQAFPDDNARLEHIFAKQVYGLAPTEIIYRIAISYILGFAKGHGITAHHIRQADTLEFAKAGTMERELDKIFRD